MNKYLLFAATMLSVMSLVAQRSNVVVTFTCRTTDSLYVRPDRIVMEDIDFGWTETLYFPDTVCHLLYGIGLSDYSEEFGLVVSPNPFDGTTTVDCNLLVPGEMTVEVTDLGGRSIVTRRDEVQQPGRYTFRITLSRPGVYLMNLRQAVKTVAAKLVNIGRGGNDAVELVGTFEDVKGTVQVKSFAENTTGHPFHIGDQMRYVAYASDNASAEVLQCQYESDTVTLVFEPFLELGDSLPCSGTPTVTDYDGNIYSTVKIGHQCWLRENLRSTHYADGTEIPLGGVTGSSIEPSYYDYPIPGLTLVERGYLYNWAAVMNGDSSSVGDPSGVQGVCPDGWHVPSAAEWYQLLLYVGGQSEYLCNAREEYIGKALAAKTGWPESPYACCVGHYSYTNNATGFSGFSAGYNIGSMFDNSGAFFWSCTHIGMEPTAAHLATNSQYLSITNLGLHVGMSVRCLRD